MTCPQCGVLAAEGARFCASCGSALAPVCPSCGSEVADDARFCASCGTPLRLVEPALSAGEELKVISVLFCDLVGFTSHAERTDPESVRERLTVYHAGVRADVERFGGRVEKLMGDGVFAVFGSPVVHEDDPERAVRAALRIQESIHELNAANPDLSLAARVAVTTGEAILQLSDTPDREGIIGDVVNTASRLQGEAPVGAVVVDERTYMALRDIVEFVPLDRVEVKGKTGSLALWRAIAARSRFGVAVDVAGSDVFVGRSHELNLLTEALRRTEGQSSAQLVTIVGEPGVGKSRLVHELYRWVDDRPDLVWWRQGRCLPYGDGITFWALGEIVKSQAGILEAEPPADVAAKLQTTVSSVIEDKTEAEWVRSRLAPLVGLPGTGAERDELFGAWHRFIEALASRRPLVLVIEDIHWAHEAMFDFLEYVLDWSRDLPILLVCTARSDLYTERPEWGGGRRDAVTIGLTALDQRETMELVTALSKRAVMPAEAQHALLERSGGNPLYVTEYVRLASERGMLDRLGEADLPLPDTIQALIAARLDLMSPEDKAIVQAGAVIGKVFWTGALAFLRGVDIDFARLALRRMSQRELIRPVRRSSMLGQEEHSFVHVLARDVAYGQIPRSERASLHLAAARWLEAKAEDRLIDVAEQLAHHYSTAVRLHPSTDRDVKERAFRFVMMAAERAENLDARQAVAFYRSALEFADDPADRGSALLGIGKNDFNDIDAGIRVTDEAYAEFVAAGNQEGQVDALALRSSIEWYRGDGEVAQRTSDEVLRLAEDMAPSQALAEALVSVAARYQLAGMEEEALETVERATAVAQSVGSTYVYARALVIRGSSLVQLGDFRGQADVEEGLRIFLDLNRSQEVMSAYNNHATFLIAAGDVRRGREIIDEAIAFGTARSLSAHVDWSKATKCEALFPMGNWDELESIVSDLLASDEVRGGSQVGQFAREWHATILFHRGKLSAAHRAWPDIIEYARGVEDPQVLVPSLALGVAVCHAVGDRALALSLAEELLEMSARHRVFGALHLPTCAREILDLGLADRLESVLGVLVTSNSEFLAAQRERMRGLVSEQRGEFEDAIVGFTAVWEVGDPLGQRFWAATARVDAGRVVLKLGRDAGALLAEARAVAEEIGAHRLLDEIAALSAGQMGRIRPM
jgi:class 3 adenylate cyclase/tetratricopeptide (TPR) repeat protein